MGKRFYFIYVQEELHTLLINAKIHGPYILVGHSFGGNNMRLFANKYPNEVRGVILLDSVHENIWDILGDPPLETLQDKILFKNKNICRFVSSIGFFRFFYSSPKSYNAFPDSIAKIYSKLNSTTKLDTTLFETARLNRESLNQVKGSTLGDKPLIVISAGLQEEDEQQVWEELQKDLTTKSSNSKQLIAEDCDHMLTRNNPKIIINSIYEMAQQLNQKSS